MNFLELVKARYSARKYANRPVEAEKWHSCISPWQYNHVIQRLWTL